MLLIFVPEEKSPRLVYILNEILVKRLQISYTLTDSLDYFLRSKMPKINYGTSILTDCINIPAHTLLFEESIKKNKIEVQKNPQFLFTFFQITLDNSKFVEIPKQHLPFDIFSAAFYLLSRYEEYAFPNYDLHGRYKPDKSLAYSNQFLKLPLVDIWSIELGKTIQKLYPTIEYQLQTFKQIHTFDIDFAYKYKGLSKFQFYKKAIANLVKLNFKELETQFNPQLPDEYDTFDFIFSELEKNQTTSIFFFLVASKRGKYDKNLSPTSQTYVHLAKNIANKFPVGLHPSYHASSSKKLILTEKQHLEKMQPHPISNSRFHYLKFKLPYSYNYLIENNLNNDYSMAYSSKIGFRASTCHPFNFFNLVENKATDLNVFSPCIMDVTLKNHENLSPENAISEINKLKETVKSVNGIFMSIWHNSNLTNTPSWQDWIKVWQQMQD